MALGSHPTAARTSVLPLDEDTLSSEDTAVMPVGILKRLRAAGLRLTVPRICVLQVIESAAPRGVCADDIFRQTFERGTKISTGTVYRAIGQLEEAGLVVREWDANRKAHYRIPLNDTDRMSLRLVCPDTGRLSLLADPALHDALLAAAQRHGVELEGRDLLIMAGATSASTAPFGCRPHHSIGDGVVSERSII